MPTANQHRPEPNRTRRAKDNAPTRRDTANRRSSSFSVDAWEPSLLDRMEKAAQGRYVGA